MGVVGRPFMGKPGIQDDRIDILRLCGVVQESHTGAGTSSSCIP